MYSFKLRSEVKINVLLTFYNISASQRTSINFHKTLENDKLSVTVSKNVYKFASLNFNTFIIFLNDFYAYLNRFRG